MNSYEALLILDPNIPEADVAGFVQSFEKDITDDGGAIDQRDIQGKKPLAYKIKGQTDGVFTLLNFKLPSSSVKKMERKLKLAAQVIRYLLIKN